MKYMCTQFCHESYSLLVPVQQILLKLYFGTSLLVVSENIFAQRKNIYIVGICGIVDMKINFNLIC